MGRLFHFELELLSVSTSITTSQIVGQKVSFSVETSSGSQRWFTGYVSRFSWVGYDDAWVEIAGKRVQSVPGGTHWGGGMSVSSEDQALVGQLLLDNGMAQGKRVLSAEWIKRMRTPCAIAPFYGYLVWLNDQRKVFPSLPESSYFAVGAGSSFTWIEPELNMVVIIRWLNSAHADAVFGKIYEAVKAIAK
jgi:CubicO group peptidase (beta-lactamase class C family)